MFSNQIKELIENELFNTNYGRILILKKFEEIILKCDFNKNLKVCVIGGSVKEPEILLLTKLGFNLNITTFGIEDTDDVFFDLNQTNKIDNIEYIKICNLRLFKEYLEIDGLYFLTIFSSFK